MAYDKRSYDAAYIRDHIICKRLSLNRSKPEDVELINWLDTRPEGVSAYLKRLIRRDMESHQDP